MEVARNTHSQTACVLCASHSKELNANAASVQYLRKPLKELVGLSFVCRDNLDGRVFSELLFQYLRNFFYFCYRKVCIWVNGGVCCVRRAGFLWFVFGGVKKLTLLVCRRLVCLVGARSNIPVWIVLKVVVNNVRSLLHASGLYPNVRFAATLNFPYSLVPVFVRVCFLFCVKFLNRDIPSSYFWLVYSK